jgi:electron transfer flavoprotein alpha subunit
VILVVGEQRDGRLHGATREAVAAARRLAGDGPVTAALLGGGRTPALGELAAVGVQEVLAVSHPALDPYTADGFVMALQGLIDARAPSYVVLPHTYQTRDFAPALAARLVAPLVTDVTKISGDRGAPTFMRSMFHGKLTAEVRAVGAPCLVTCQIGAFRSNPPAAFTPVSITDYAASVDRTQIRQQPEPPFREDRETVDLGQAQRIVAVGRGIKGEEHLVVAERLARALDADLAASRPICDSGWLPMERQVGSSGQTVAPALYVALGISGATQHLVGMRGSRTVVAVNKDADAPIFEVADFAVVGDLFEIAPAIVEALEKQ